MSCKFLIAAILTALFALGALVSLTWMSSPLRAQEDLKFDAATREIKAIELKARVDRSIEMDKEVHPPGVFHIVVSPIEVFEVCKKELQWDMWGEPGTSSNPKEKRVMWTLKWDQPFSNEQLNYLAKQENTELILNCEIQIWLDKSQWEVLK